MFEDLISLKVGPPAECGGGGGGASIVEASYPEEAGGLRRPSKVADQ